MSPEARERATQKTEAIIHDLSLNELRGARALTQERLAKCQYASDGDQRVGGTAKAVVVDVDSTGD